VLRGNQNSHRNFSRPPTGNQFSHVSRFLCRPTTSVRLAAVLHRETLPSLHRFFQLALDPENVKTYFAVSHSSCNSTNTPSYPNTTASNIRSSFFQFSSLLPFPSTSLHLFTSSEGSLFWPVVLSTTEIPHQVLWLVCTRCIPRRWCRRLCSCIRRNQSHRSRASLEYGSVCQKHHLGHTSFQTSRTRQG
jgi:hypothetical protein